LFIKKNSPTSSHFQLRSLEKSDYPKLTNFLRGEIRIHRHLDWREPQDWLGEHPFIAAEKDGEIQAILALPDDPPGIYWIRLFALRRSMDVREMWDILLAKSLPEIRGKNHQPLATLAYSDWFQQLLLSSQWTEHQKVVLMKYIGKSKETPEMNDEYLLRPMFSGDVARVAVVDQSAFEPLWQQSEDAIRQAYSQISYATVMEHGGKIIGFQMTTTNAYNAHLARLAVLPGEQGRGVGTALVMDMLSHFKPPFIREITVNTQQDNPNSIKLYQKLGFVLTGESFPIFIYPL